MTVGVFVGPRSTAAVSLGHIHSCPPSLVDTSTKSQHKSFKLLKLENLSQETKENFLRICNKTLRRVLGLKPTHCYLFKSNPIQMSQKALCSYLLPLLCPAQYKLCSLPGGLRTDPWGNRRSQTTAYSLETLIELHSKPLSKAPWSVPSC